MNLELLKRFYAIAEEGGLLKASRKLHVVPSALTRSISQFEHQLKTLLFERDPKGMKLTPQGERLYVFAKQILTQTDSFERVFHEKEDEVEGEIRILTTPYVGANWLIPHMKEFIIRYPKVIPNFIFNNDKIDNLGEADVGICPFISQQVGLVHELLFPLYNHLFASQEYLEKFGVPRKPEDLDEHRLIAYKEDYRSPYGNWILNVGRSSSLPPRKPYVQADTLDGMVKCAIHGMGIVEAPDLTCISKSELKEIMPEVAGPQVTYYFICHEKRKISKKINTLFRYLSEKGK